MRLAPSARIYQEERVAARAVAGSALVVVLDKKELHRLNAVGARIWELCDGRKAEEICELMASEFEVERDQAASDLEAFVDQLVQVGAVRVEAP